MTVSDLENKVKMMKQILELFRRGEEARRKRFADETVSNFDILWRKGTL